MFASKLTAKAVVVPFPVPAFACIGRLLKSIEFSSSPTKVICLRPASVTSRPAEAPPTFGAEIQRGYLVLYAIASRTS